jgi:acyl carrier protein
MAESTRDRIVKVLATVTQNALPADDDESLFAGGVLDSFSLPDLVSALEKEFDIEVPDNDLNPRKFDSIARMESFITDRT